MDDTFDDSMKCYEKLLKDEVTKLVAEFKVLVEQVTHKYKEAWRCSFIVTFADGCYVIAKSMIRVNAQFQPPHTPPALSAGSPVTMPTGPDAPTGTSSRRRTNLKTKRTASLTRRSTWMRSKDSTSSTSRDWDHTSSSGRNKSRTGSSHRRPDWNKSSSGRCQPLTMVVHQTKLTSLLSTNVSASKLKLG